jgi:L,D-peptidoglycan transpeptidase YkuD (ErfK/YbiS/YcfS/YnhG family)
MAFHRYDEKKMKQRPFPAISLVALSGGSTRGFVKFGTAIFPCALGRSGQRARKREGDGATPIGRWTLVEVLYRSDRVMRPSTRLPVRPIRPEDGWCDAIGDRNYNRCVRHPYPVSAERLWRQDRVYDLVVVLSHNRRPRVQGHGSAVFMHLARPGYSATEGCIALTERNLRLLLARANQRMQLAIAS